MDAFDSTCQLVDFDVSSGKPCALNQTNTSGSCQKVRSFKRMTLIPSHFPPTHTPTHTHLQIRFCIFTCILPSTIPYFVIGKLHPFIYLFIYLSIRMYEQLHKYNARPSVFSQSGGYHNFFYYPSIFLEHYCHSFY